MPFELTLDTERVRVLSSGLLTSKEIENETRSIVQDAVIQMAILAGQYAPKGATGNLKRSFNPSKVRKVGDAFVAQTDTDVFYASWVDEGTGLFGPFRTRVVSPTGNPMFYPGSSEKYIRYKEIYGKAPPKSKTGKPPFLNSYRGQKGKGYWLKAYEVMDKYVEGRLQHFRLDIESRLSAIRRVGDAGARGIVGGGGSGISIPRQRFSASGLSNILPGNLPGTIRTRSIKTGVSQHRLSKGPGGGQFTSALEKKVASQRKRAIRRTARRRNR